MVKVRMNTADVAAEVKCLRRLIGMRCSNVYDLTPKTYIFKLMNSSGVTESGESEKVLLLMESGVRLHTTAYVRDKSNTPSGFTLKLRKHIRTRRLEDVRQLGYDRIVLFQFGLGANAHYVILELYAQGNIILTDSEFMVMTLLRSHRDDDKGFAIMSRHRYPTEFCRIFERTTSEKLHGAFSSCKDHENGELVDKNEGGKDISEVKTEKSDGRKSKKSSEAAKKTTEGSRIRQATLKSVLGEALGYGPALSEHMILDVGLVPNMKLPKDSIVDDATIQVLSQGIQKFEDWLQDVISGDRIPEGYILLQKQISGKVVQSNSGSQIYDEFCPILLNQFKSREYMTFETFDLALDEFYSKIESQRAEQQQKAKEETAIQKLNKIRFDQENRVHTLKKEVDHCVKLAQLIEYNTEDVDAAIIAVRVALAKGMNWEDLARMVKEEKKAGNPVAGLIDKLYLERNCMTLLLSNNLDEMDDDEKTLPVDKVEVDLALSAHGNACRWYEMKKKQESKQEKTMTAHEKAFKAAERKTRLQLSQEKKVAMISHMRKVHWFEKFNWFISSENYLIISGRDAQQNEMIVKRYMEKGDLYVHAELHGASSTVIKNHRPDQPVPPLTLNQAGCFTVCHSQAWDSKIVTSAWWVYPHQVSKTAPTGEYLTAGSFMIRGKKNFLPPQPLVMGFGLLFRMDESSLGSHLNERRVRGEEERINDFEEDEPLKEEPDSDSEGEAEKMISVESESAKKSFKDLSKPGSEGMSAADYKESDEHHLTAEVARASDDLGHKNLDVIVDAGIASVNPELEDLLDRALGLGSIALSSKNYNHESIHKDLVEETQHEGEKASARDKPYVSKADRKKLKKGQKGIVLERVAVEGDKKVKESDASESQSMKNVQTVKERAGKISRGQRSKLKKIKEKYADQDEEERRSRVVLLAPAGKVQEDNGESLEENTVLAKDEQQPSGHANAPKVCYKCKKVGHLSRDCLEHSEETSGRHTSGRVEDSEHLSSRGTAEMDKVAMEEDDIHEIGEDEKEKLNDLDFLTGNPLSTDILLYAVPVCGPYNALQSYKFRVKIIPGTAKKGKAAKTAMNLFSHMSEATSREKELMKACTDPELVAAIIGNVKISAAGLTQLKQKQKKPKKGGKEGH
ncbi:hypothetical protein SAY87_023785 [Trapa incisa]|uniref:CCHC-type domain-containing protein n=1 Tax=Trapa incisa TaxID=236973 RepID=A0AAN7L182_9MYRT|nr:hypothetical protein SAY87_023785 [Trapa incisa]